ncbi:hypothetical protein B0A55_00467 [Friedmanniomyces simplex]|uniref:F-box domain-containing protein n=1 Tax=Friedmanniomyces simplex TaxID=329884 RepID=A0A4U0Y537_9PEZI|nr:hypothetical protein B0A55_00467 [Friedmanniomyces simplex]
MRPIGSRKRKRPVLPSSPWSTTTPNPGPITTHQKADPTQPSLLLDLPPELRNSIYDAVLATTGGARLSTKPHVRNLAFASALPRTSKQVQDDFLTAAWLLADIYTLAPNFSFRHIVTFLNRLPEAELRALPITLPAQRKVVVTIVPNSGLGPEFLECWVRRAAHPTKKGTEVRYEYSLPAGYREDEFQRQQRRRWEYEAGVMKEGPAREEFGRILEVLRQGARGS